MGVVRVDCVQACVREVQGEQHSDSRHTLSRFQCTAQAPFCSCASMHTSSSVPLRPHSPSPYLLLLLSARSRCIPYSRWSSPLVYHAVLELFVSRHYWLHCLGLPTTTHLGQAPDLEPVPHLIDTRRAIIDTIASEQDHPSSTRRCSCICYCCSISLRQTSLRSAPSYNGNLSPFLATWARFTVAASYIKSRHQV